MGLKYSKKLSTIFISVGLVTAFQASAMAADTTSWLSSLFGGQETTNSTTANSQTNVDQQQIDADVAANAQFRQTYEADRQAMAQAQEKYRQNQRAGLDTTADRQNIRNLEIALNADIAHLQASAQDMARNGINNPYTVPMSNGNFTANNNSWNRRDQGNYYNNGWQPYPQQNNNGRWQDNSGRWHDNRGRWQDSRGRWNNDRDNKKDNNGRWQDRNGSWHNRDDRWKDNNGYWHSVSENS